MLGLVLTLVTSVTSVTSGLNKDLEWLAFCSGTDTKKYIIHNTAPCPEGFYFKTSFKNLCVCGNGVWKLSNDFCGKTWIVDAEDGDCFEVPDTFGIRWIRYLGHTHAPKKEFNFVTDSTMTKVVKMDDSGFTDAGYSSVVTVNPRRAFSDCSNELCYKMGKSLDSSYQPGEPMPRMMWGDVPKELGMYATAQCVPNPTVDAQLFPKGVPRHGSYYTLQDGGAEFFLRPVVSDKCRQRCLPNFNNVSFDDSVWTDGRLLAGHGIMELSSVSNPSAWVSNSTNTTEPAEELVSVSSNSTDGNSTLVNITKPFPFHIPKKSECKLKKDTMSLGDKKRKNLAAQTQRLAEHHFSSAILGKRAPLIEMPEFEYLRTGRLVFEKVCPATEVPPTVFKSLLVMFRVALNESLTVTPYEHLGDIEEDSRLKKGMEECLAAAANKPFKVTYDLAHCPPQMEGFFLDRKTNGPMPMDPNVPCDVSHIPAKFDYPIETAWKLVMFTNYFCATNFNVTAFDHSRLMYKLRSLFNKDIVTRWYNPGLANKVFQYIFNDFELDKVMVAIDRCVAGARFISPFTSWIKRPQFEGGMKPTNDSTTGSHPKEIQVLKGLGKCLSTRKQIKEMSTGKCPHAEEIKPPKCKQWSG